MEYTVFKVMRIRGLCVDAKMSMKGQQRSRVSFFINTAPSAGVNYYELWRKLINRMTRLTGTIPNIKPYDF